MGCGRRVQRGGEALREGVMIWCDCRAAWQTSGATPLHVASNNGHVECVRTLLGGGAAINQAMVGCAGSMARHPGGCVCGSLWETACMHAFAAGWVRWDGTRWRVWARGDRAHGILQVMGSIATFLMGCSRRVRCGGEALHDGVMCWCECRAAWQKDGATPLCIASNNGHVECVRALLGGGAAINQAKVGSAGSMARLRGVLCVRVSVGVCVYVCVCSWFGALEWRALEGLGER